MLVRRAISFRNAWPCSRSDRGRKRHLLIQAPSPENPRYGNQWEAKFRQRFETEMIGKSDTHFFVGTVHQHPGSWIIVGLFYPPKQTTADLFDEAAN